MSSLHLRRGYHINFRDADLTRYWGYIQTEMVEQEAEAFERGEIEVGDETLEEGGEKQEEN